MLTNRITRYGNTTSTLSDQASALAVLSAAQFQPTMPGPLALQIIAMQTAYEQALHAAREEASQLFARQLQSSLN